MADHGLGLFILFTSFKRFNETGREAMRALTFGHIRFVNPPGGAKLKILFGLPYLFAALFLSLPPRIFAGPPFVTDDPEPVDYQHWEVYLASQHAKTAHDWSGTAPHVEVNYGVIPNMQLHLIAPLAYDAPAHEKGHYGYGDTELGVKFRFIQETPYCPQVAVFPLVELPTGSEKDGLGAGHVQTFLPVWLQKGFGEWTVYGGGGYAINSGEGHPDWGFVGLVVERHLVENVLLGGELYHRTSMEAGGRSDTAFNLGTVIDISDQHHILFSAGRSIDGPTDFQTYIAYQFTFGPELFHSGTGAPQP